MFLFFLDQQGYTGSRMEEKRFTCLNGRFVLAHRAAVAVDDRGFRFGDGLFETIRVSRGVPYQWQAHMQRLSQGLIALHIPLPMGDLRASAKQLLKKNEAQEGFIRLAISRGSGSRGYLPHPQGLAPVWVMEWIDGIALPEKPARLWLSARPKIPPACLPTASKLAHGLNNTLALIDATDNGADEALQLSIDGHLSETASANLFWIAGDQLYTPSLETGCLAGTTREALLRLTPVPARLVREGLGSLQHAQAVFLTNARVGIWPVAHIEPMGWRFEATHPLLKRLQLLLAEDRQRDLFAHRKQWASA